MAKLHALIALLFFISMSAAVVLTSNVTKGDIYRVSYGTNESPQEARFIVYDVAGGTSPSADIAVISEQLNLRNGDLVQGMGTALLTFEGESLKSIHAGRVSQNASRVNVTLADSYAGETYIQSVYDQPDSYDSQFMPAIPRNASYHRIILDYRGGQWLLAEANKSLGVVILYKEGMASRLSPGDMLFFQDFSIGLMNVSGGAAQVRLEAGLLPTTLSVQAVRDAQKQMVSLFVQYNSTLGPIDTATCFLSGDVSGPLAYSSDGYYKNYFGYANQQKDVYEFEVSCLADQFQPQKGLKRINISTIGQLQPGPQPGPAGQPPGQKNILQQIIEFIAGIIRSIFGGK